MDIEIPSTQPDQTPEPSKKSSSKKGKGLGRIFSKKAKDDTGDIRPAQSPERTKRESFQQRFTKRASKMMGPAKRLIGKKGSPSSSKALPPMPQQRSRSAPPSKPLPPTPGRPRSAPPSKPLPPTPGRPRSAPPSKPLPPTPTTHAQRPLPTTEPQRHGEVPAEQSAQLLPRRPLPRPPSREVEETAAAITESSQTEDPVAIIKGRIEELGTIRPSSGKWEDMTEVLIWINQMRVSTNPDQAERANESKKSLAELVKNKTPLSGKSTRLAKQMAKAKSGNVSQFSKLSGKDLRSMLGPILLNICLGLPPYPGGKTTDFSHILKIVNELPAREELLKNFEISQLLLARCVGHEGATTKNVDSLNPRYQKAEESSLEKIETLTLLYSPPSAIENWEEKMGRLAVDAEAADHTGDTKGDPGTSGLILSAYEHYISAE